MDKTLWETTSTLRAMIQKSPLAIVAIGHDGKVATWNQAARRMFGWSEDEVLGQPPPYIPDDKQDEFRELWERELGGEFRTGLELRRKRKDGSLIDVSLSTAPIRDSAGQIVGVLGLLEDITKRKQAEEALLMRSQQLEAVRTVSIEIARELDLSKLLSLIHRRAMELVGASGGSLYLWDEESQQLFPQVWMGLPESVEALPIGRGEGLCGTVAVRRVGMIVDDYRSFPQAHPRFLAETVITTALAEPLQYRDRLVGVIVVNHQNKGRFFTAEDQGLLSLFAAQATIAIENARLYQDAERQRREIEVVADLSQRLNASLDLDTVLQRVAEGARTLTGSDLAQIALRDGRSDALVFRYGAGSQSEHSEGRRIEPGKGVGGKVLITGQPFRTGNYAEDPRITKDYLAATLSEGVVTELAAPIRTEGQMEGVLFVDNRSLRPFTDRDERTLQRLADHAAIAIRNARLHAMVVKRSQQFASVDTVTQALMTELDPHLVTQRILEAVQKLIPGAAAILLEQPEGVQWLHVVASIGLRNSTAGRSIRLRAGEGLAGIATATRQPVVSAGVAWDSRFANRSWAASEGLVSGIVLPLVYGDRVAGILSVFLRHPHTFGVDEIELLRAFAAQSAIALENARLFEQVRVGREQLLDLTQQVVSAQEVERQRLSRELHDEAGQALTALRISLGLIRGDLPSEADSLRRRLEETTALAESITDRLRLLAQALRPPALDSLGLDVTLEGLCRDVSRRTQLAIVYEGIHLPRLPGEIGIHLYRFLQEALTNVTKHAKANQVRVVLEYADGMISLLVQDDGIGFDVAAQFVGTSRTAIGLIGVRERMDLLKGRLEITSQPGEGTRLVARVPWKGTP